MKTELFEKYKHDRTSKEYETYFLRYSPQDIHDRKQSTESEEKIQEDSKIKKARTKTKKEKKRGKKKTRRLLRIFNF